jgi:NadR type nicotinamide-nucleotide adenylyltransferase
MTRGFVLGKFLPPHDGHVLLCEIAQARVDELTILVCSLPDDPISGVLRTEWMRALFPKAYVLHHDAIVPQAPEEHPDFWPIWRGIVKTAHPEPIDYVFASEGYGARLAVEVGATFHPVDPERVIVPVSGTAVRAHPFGNWRYLPEPVRGHYARTVSLHGPESVGKSVLSEQLAARLGATLTPEFGRTWCEVHGTDCTMDDLLAIAKTQQAMIAAAKPRSNGWVVTDTDALMTAVWADMMLGKRDPWFDTFDQTADLYLLLDIDLPFVDDGLRLYSGAEERKRFFDLCREELERRGVAWALVSGTGSERLESALAAIRAAFGT